jgi:hypothetical protein
MTDPSVMTVTRRSGYPYILKPEGGREIQRVYLVLAQFGPHEGLWAWQGSPDRLAYRGDVDWAATGPVPVDTTVPVTVHLTDGTTVEVVKGGACSSCGPMARWNGPDWSHVVQVRS